MKVLMIEDNVESIQGLIDAASKLYPAEWTLIV